MVREAHDDMVYWVHRVEASCTKHLAVMWYVVRYTTCEITGTAFTLHRGQKEGTTQVHDNIIHRAEAESEAVYCF